MRVIENHQNSKTCRTGPTHDDRLCTKGDGGAGGVHGARQSTYHVEDVVQPAKPLALHGIEPSDTEDSRRICPR